MMKTPFYRRFGRAFAAGWQEMRMSSRGAYDAARTNRLLQDWIRQARTADEELRAELKVLRARSRDLARNNSYARRYFKLLQNNVVGPNGMMLRAQVWRGDDLDDAVNDAIEVTWNEWANSPVTLDGKLTLRRLEKLLLKTMACDGEAIVRVVGAPNSRFGFLLQPIDPDQIDETYNRLAAGGENEIRMGIELDQLDRVVGYWVWDRPQSGYSVTRRREFIPASEIIHLYDPDRVNQTRGIPWITSIMVPAHMLNAYEESESVGARIGAAHGGWLVKRGEGLGIDLSDKTTPVPMQANPGTFQVVPDGYDPVPFAPQHPTAQFGAFVKQLLRKISSGMSVFYNILANDAEGVTYSTMRSFLLVERDDWRAIQQDFIDMWRRPLYRIWFDRAYTSGRLAVGRIGDEKPAVWLARMHDSVIHRPRGWQWIDPEKEIKANVLAIQNGLATCTGILAALGIEVEDLYAERARELRLAKKYGIPITGALPELAEDTKPEEEE